MKYLIFLSALLSVSAMAEGLRCKNAATGAELIIYQQTFGPVYSMNSALAESLKSQGSSGVVTYGNGQFDLSGGEIIFTSGAPHGYSLNLRKHSGGTKLNYRPYGGWPSEFYFNPGECQ